MKEIFNIENENLANYIMFKLDKVDKNNDIIVYER